MAEDASQTSAAPWAHKKEGTDMPAQTPEECDLLLFQVIDTGDLAQLRQFGDSEKNLRSHFSRFVSVWPPEASLTRNYTALPVAIPM